MSNEDGTPSAIQENIKYLKRENTLKHIRRYVIRKDQSVGEKKKQLSLHLRRHPFGRSCPNVLFVCCSLVQANPEITMDCIIHMSQNITPSQRAKLLHLLPTMDNTSNS